MIYWLIILLPIAVLVLLEAGARLYHRMKFLVPFHSKLIGEYPFSQFLEETDPPLYFRFKKNFHSPMVNLNRFRCRGPEPAPEGQKKRMLVISESYLFGVKLLREEQLWSVILQNKLDQRMPGQWEVLNAANPGYNTDQHLAMWREELKATKPDIVVVGMGGNDEAIVSMMGPEWKPGSPWPIEFIMALERKSPWWKKLLNHFCFYFLWRRAAAGPAHSNFPAPKGEIPRRACHENIKDNYRALVKEAREMGAKVACTFYAPAVDFDLDEREKRKVASIQANWRETLETRTGLDLALINEIIEDLCTEMELPFIDMHQKFRGEPRRFEMYFDLAHWNQRGMPVVARTFMDEIDKLGWWS
jgi:lysophospholipase L1-like esterase